MDPLSFALPWSDALGAVALLIRASAFIAVAPVLGATGLSYRMRIGLALLLVILLAPVVPPADPETTLIALVIGEMFTGVVIAFGARMVIEAAVYAGGLAGFPAGLALAQFLDPQTELSVPALGTLYRLLTILTFLALGGHLELIAIFGRSYEVVPVGAAVLSGPWLEELVSMTGRVFILAFRLAAPVIAAGLLTDLCLMLIARAVPQMHILIVGAPIRLTVGLLAVGFSLHVLVPLFGDALQDAARDTGQALRALAPAG